MATPKQNFLNQLRAYAQPTPVYAPADIPVSVRTYSVFDPSSNTWRRMTNDGRSPIPVQGQPVVPVQPMTPAQEQAAVAGALTQAQQTQGRVYSPLPQTPSRGSRTPSPASKGGGAVPVQGQPSRASQRAVEAPAASVIPEIPGNVSVRAPAELYQGAGIAPDGTVIQQSPLTTVTRQGLSVPEISSAEEIIKTNIPYAVPVDPMFTPEFDAKAYNYSQGTLEGNIKRTRNTFNNFLSLLPLGSKKLNTAYSNHSMADLAKNYYNHKLHPSMYSNKYAKPETLPATNIGGGLGKAQYRKESTGSLLGAMRKPLKIYESPHADTQSLPTQKVIINPNVERQVIVQKPGGMTIWDRYRNSSNYSEGFLNPYMKYNYGSKLNIPFLPFTR